MGDQKHPFRPQGWGFIESASGPGFMAPLGAANRPVTGLATDKPPEEFRDELELHRRTLPEQLKYWSDKLATTAPVDIPATAAQVMLAMMVLAEEIENTPKPEAEYIVFDSETRGYKPVCAFCARNLPEKGILHVVPGNADKSQ